MNFVVKGRQEEPVSQTHDDVFSSPLGVTVVAVTSTYHDGAKEYAVYIEDTENPEKFNIVGSYDGSAAGELDSDSASFIATRTLEIMAELKGGAA